MNTFIIEAAAIFALAFIVYRGTFAVLGAKVPAVSREKIFYAHAAMCGLPFAFASCFVLPHLTTSLNFYARSNSWGKMIEFGGVYVLLIVATGLLAVVFAYILFKMITKEKSVWELIKSGNGSVMYLLNGIIVTTGIMAAVLSGEIAKAIVPFAPVPYNF